MFKDFAVIILDNATILLWRGGIPIDTSFFNESTEGISLTITSDRQIKATLNSGQYFTLK